jgi:hypothetical protein
MGGVQVDERGEDRPNRFAQHPAGVHLQYWSSFPLLNSSILDQECDLLDDLNERLTCPGESGF